MAAPVAPGAMPGGLFDKYEVRPLSDPSGKHADCRFFVLDPEHDPIARSALSAYAAAARSSGKVGLADDLDQWCAEVAAHAE